jgi:DNA-binding SARP family transcriptional activator
MSRALDRQSDGADAVLRLRLLGGFSAWVDGRPVEHAAWRRRKVSRLVKLLALAPDHRLHREQVECRLWPELGPRAASQNLHHTLYRARHTLEPGLERRAEPRFLRLQNDLLELAPPDALESDLDAFELAAATAFASGGDVALYARAVALFGGELLPEERFEDWAIDRRDTVKATYVELLLELADLERARARLDAAIEALKRIVAIEPLHEDAQSHLIHLHGLAGRRHLAVAHFERFRTVLRTELDAEPLPSTVEVYRSVVSGRIRPPAALATEVMPDFRRFRGEHATPALELHR